MLCIHDLNDHKPYSIPDILRMNDFEVEVTVKHRHYVNLSPAKFRLNNWVRTLND